MSKEVKEVLIHARKKIEQGWTQRTFARDKNGVATNSTSEEAVCWCIIGSINSCTTSKYLIINKARDAVQKVVLKDLDESITDGVVYIRKDSVKNVVPVLSGKRAVLVIDRGWVVAGDVTEENGRIKVSRALHVFSWTNGYAAMVANPKAAKADLRPLPNGFDIPADSEIFRSPVEDNWGL